MPTNTVPTIWLIAPTASQFIYAPPFVRLTRHKISDGWRGRAWLQIEWTSHGNWKRGAARRSRIAWLGRLTFRMLLYASSGHRPPAAARLADRDVELDWHRPLDKACCSECPNPRIQRQNGHTHCRR